MLYNTKNIKWVESIDISKNNEKRSENSLNIYNIEKLQEIKKRIVKQTKIFIKNCQIILKNLTDINFETSNELKNLELEENLLKNQAENFFLNIKKIEEKFKNKFKMTKIKKTQKFLEKTINKTINKTLDKNDYKNYNKFRKDFLNVSNRKNNFLNNFDHLNSRYRNYSNKKKNEIMSNLVMYKFELLKKKNFN